MFAVDINGTRTHLVSDATEADARTLAEVFGSKVYSVRVSQEWRADWSKVHGENAGEERWFDVYTYSEV